MGFTVVWINQPGDAIFNSNFKVVFIFGLVASAIILSYQRKLLSLVCFVKYWKYANRLLLTGWYHLKEAVLISQHWCFSENGIDEQYLLHKLLFNLHCFVFFLEESGGKKINIEKNLKKIYLE